MRHTQCVIHLDRLEQNLHLIRQTAPDKKIMAMVKADAYGHGMLPVASFLEGKTDWFGVASIEEGVALRQAGIKTPILHIEPTNDGEEDAVANDIDQSVCAADAVRRIEQAACLLGKTACVQIKIETGMNRTGVRPGKDLAELLSALSQSPHTRLTGIFTHFYASDAPESAQTDAQAERFSAAVQQIKEAGFDGFLIHCANSGAVLKYPQYHFDMLRPGIVLYGYYPSSDMKKTVPFLPVMDVQSEVLLIKNVYQGETVSYSGTFTAPRDMRVAVVAIGYGDGYKRSLSNKASVLIGGKRARIVGNICMDMMMVDVTDIPDAHLGSQVVLIGSQGEEKIDADELASLCGTISYEILTSFLPRIPKIYKGAPCT